MALAGSATNTTVIVVVGAAGEEEFGRQFIEWSNDWRKAAKEAGAECRIIGVEKSDKEDRDSLKALLDNESKDASAELWIVLLGHGTFDGKAAKFNLRGPDVSAEEMAGWLKPFQRPIAVINASSSSAPFINALSGHGRVVITATRSGHEQNFARFGQYFSKAIGDREADLDKDGQTSLLEAYLTAAYRVTDFYKADGRLATEHALLDDNGDGLGTPADWFRGVRAVKRAKEGAQLDGFRAHQFHLVRSEQERRMPAEMRKRRDELELAVAQLRDRKSTLPEQEYYTRLEKLLLELAKLYQEVEKQAKAPSTPVAP
ncbi:MAG: hypothetical protein AB1705_15540 [Verrucomicrobiota bacterium]